MKKNTRSNERSKILRTIDDHRLPKGEEGNIGTVSLSRKKVKRWRKELEQQAALHGVEGKLHYLKPDRGELTEYCLAGSELSERNAGADQRSTEVDRNSQVFRKLRPPREFQMVEGLMFSINAYITGMYDQGIWHPFSSPQSQKPLYLESQNKCYQICNDFAGSVFTATQLLKTRSFIEARKRLSNACGQVQDVIISTHPSTLGSILKLFYEMGADGLEVVQDAVELLREFIGKMATVVLHPSHPWRAIWCLFGTLDRELLLPTTILAYRRLADVLEKKEGRYSKDPLFARVQSIRYDSAPDASNGEAALRKLLEDCPLESTDERLSVTYILLENLQRQGRNEECEAIAIDCISMARTLTYIDVMNTLLYTAKAQYRLGKYNLAESNQREAVDIGLANTQQDPLILTWTLRHLRLLESWVRERGRISDADRLQAEIDVLTERDVVEEEVV